MANIEYSNNRNRFTLGDLQKRVAESQKFWNSPEGQALKRQRELEARNRKPAPTRFPDLVKQGTRPTLDPQAEVRDAAAKLGIKPVTKAKPAPEPRSPRKGYL